MGLFINYVIQSGKREGINPCITLWSDGRVKWSFWRNGGEREGVNFRAKMVLCNYK